MCGVLNRPKIGLNRKAYSPVRFLQKNSRETLNTPAVCCANEPGYNNGKATTMKKTIVTTTINPPTEAILKYQAMTDWDLIVIGDKKTPEYKLERGQYITPEMQEAYDKELSNAIGWNSIQRRNFGLLYAYDQGADIVALVDDDNIPLENWGEEIHLNRETPVQYYETDLEAFDPVGATNESQVWHRGYPLQLLWQRDYSNKSTATIIPDIQANLWQGDPDTDALCRMIYNPECHFNNEYFPMAANKTAPFNSQNTFITRQWLKHYFVLPHIGRMDDIWIAYYIQAVGAKVIFDKPTVTHARNVHDHTTDMVKEFIGYEHTLKLIQDLAKDPEKLFDYLPERSAKAFKLYQKHFD